MAGASGLPTAAHADDDGFYVAYGNSVYRYELDGSGQAPVMNTQYAVQRLHTDGNLLFINHSSGLYARVVSVNTTTNTVTDTRERGKVTTLSPQTAPRSAPSIGTTALSNTRGALRHVKKRPELAQF